MIQIPYELFLYVRENEKMRHYIIHLLTYSIGSKIETTSIKLLLDCY